MLTYQERLKLQILAHGIRIHPEAERLWREKFSGPLTLAEYASTSGVCLHTADKIWINAPFLEAFTHQAEAELVCQGLEFFVRSHGKDTPVTPTPVPSYHDQHFTDEKGTRPYTNVGVTHTDRCRVSPIEGCSWVCTFCDLYIDYAYQQKRLQDMIDVVKIAKNDPLAPARHVLVSGGTPKPEHEAWIDEVYVTLAAEAGMPVDVMMPPRKDMTYPAMLKRAGVNMMSVNLEIYDQRQARRITPNKARVFGLDYYLDYIERAVQEFGVGFVQSLILVGTSIESTESTLAGVRALAQRGCMPVLSPFRPDPTTPMGKANMPQPSVDEMIHVYEASLEICQQSGTGVLPGPRCIPCHHNTLTFPVTDFYVDEHHDLTQPP